MAFKRDIENGEHNRSTGELTEPLMAKNLADEEDGSGELNSSKQRNWMVYLSTLVAVCGSFEFGCCVSISFF